jgi:hypothetical protein
VYGYAYPVGSQSPLSGVQIACGGISTVSAPDGSYQLLNVPEGSQTLTAEKASYEKYVQKIDVRSDLKTFIYLNLQSGRVSGVISNVIDGPVRNATVSLHGVSGTTDANGVYGLTNVPLGTDTLKISHPDYLLLAASVDLYTIEKQFSAVLTKEVDVEGTITQDTYIDQSAASQNFGPSTVLKLSCNGFDSIGRYIQNNSRSILLGFDFPPLLRDNRVTVLDGSIQLWTLDNSPSVGFLVYSIPTAWSAATVMYGDQPNVIKQISSMGIGDGSVGKYWPVLQLDGLNIPLADWKANRPVYGIKLLKTGGDARYTTTFYSTEAPDHKPKVTFRVRY